MASRSRRHTTEDPPTPLPPRRKSLAPRASLAVSSRAASTSQQPTATRTKRRYRPSLLTGEYHDIDLLKREALVRGPAQAALEGLLEVGTIQPGQGEVTLDLDRVNRYRAFVTLKEAYLSNSLWLAPDALREAFPELLEDPAGPINSLIKLANLTTFIYNVLLGAPEPDGTRPKMARAALTTASIGLLSYVVPVDEAIHDGTLKLLVGLKCQIYLSAASNSRSPLAPAPFFALPLSAHFPTLASSSDPLANRESSIRFRHYCDEAVRLVEQTGGDLAVLETTEWRWDRLFGEVREYCAEVASRSLRSVEEGESGSSLGEGVGERMVEWGQGWEEADGRDESAGVQGEEEGERGEHEPKDEGIEGEYDFEEEELAEAGDDEQSGDDGQSGDEEEEEEEKDELEDEEEEMKKEDSATQDTITNSYDRERSESAVAQELGLPSPHHPTTNQNDDVSDSASPKSDTISSSATQHARNQELMDAPSSSLGTDSLATQDARNQAIRQIPDKSDDDSDEESDDMIIDEIASREARQLDEFKMLGDDDEDEDDEAEDQLEEDELEEDGVEEAASTPQPNLAQFHEIDDEGDDDETTAGESRDPGLQVQGSPAPLFNQESDGDATPLPKPKTRIKLIDSTLVRVPDDGKPRGGRFMNDQPGEKITFDSQGSQDSPAPPQTTSASPLHPWPTFVPSAPASSRDATRPQVSTSRAPPVASTSGARPVTSSSRPQPFIEIPVRASKAAPSRPKPVPAPRAPAVPPTEQGRSSRLSALPDVEDGSQDLDPEPEPRSPQRQPSPQDFHDFNDFGGGGDDRHATLSPVPATRKEKGKGRETVRSQSKSPSIVVGNSPEPAGRKNVSPTVAPRKRRAANDDDVFSTQSEDSDPNIRRATLSKSKRRPTKEVAIDSDGPADQEQYRTREAREKDKAREKKIRRVERKLKKLQRPQLASPPPTDSSSSSSSSDSDAPPRRRKRNPHRQDRNETGRIPWSQKEEALLVKEISRFAHHDYAFIIARHGPNGSVSTVLKRRNVVSLKDKARNIKIDLIRQGVYSEVQHRYLKNVTVPPEWRKKLVQQLQDEDEDEDDQLLGDE